MSGERPEADMKRFSKCNDANLDVSNASWRDAD
jgi:hypothetical protein